MITRIRNAFRLKSRRHEVEAEFEAAYAEVRRLRPRKAFRQRAWLREAEALDAGLRWVFKAPTLDDLNKKSEAIQQIVARCKAQVEWETNASATIDVAAKKAAALRQRAATLHGSAFKLAEHRHQAIKDECNHAHRARDERDEEAALKRIEDKLAAFDAFLARTEAVTATMPLIETRIGAIKLAEVWLDTGTKETYDDLLATFAETQKDIHRGDYDKAEQRLREIHTLENHLRDRGNRRAVWALQEIAMWLSSPSIAVAFPQLARFPQATISAANIEDLYALRPEIERFAAAHAAGQRERNMPTRDLAGGRKLALNHPLRMPLEDCANPAELEEFLRCISAVGRTWAEPRAEVRPTH